MRVSVHSSQYQILRRLIVFIGHYHHHRQQQQHLANMAIANIAIYAKAADI